MFRETGQGLDGDKKMGAYIVTAYPREIPRVPFRKGGRISG